MTVAKKYYWLKLPCNFFKRHDVVIMRGQPNGDQLVLLYLQLLAESIDHDGLLRYNEKTPYTEAMLATLMGHTEDNVRTLLGHCEDTGLVERMKDGTLCLTKAKDMIGTETTWAEKKRQYRASAGAKEDNVPAVSGQRPIELEIELEKELEKERTSKKLVVKTDTPPQLKDEFHRAIDEWFYTRYKYTSFGKERKAVASLAAKAKRQAQDVGEDSSEVMEAMLAAYQQLLDGSDKFWNRQPMTPSSLLALWDRVISTMRANQPVVRTKSDEELMKEPLW